MQRTDGERPQRGPRSLLDRSPPLTRRRLVRNAGVALSVAAAGCGTLPGDGTPDEQSYDRLQQTAVYVADDVSLSLPEEIPTVTATNNADLLVLPGDTDIEAQQAVDWLADERILALLGGSAEDTWLSWARSDAYDDTFQDEGVSDSEPDPQLLVAAAVGLHVTTYRHSWGDGPRDRDVLRKLDEDLTDLDTRTPH